MEDKNYSLIDWAMDETLNKIYNSHKLSKIEKILDWNRVAKVLKKADYKIEGRIGGMCYTALFMFKVMIIQTMYSFTDRQTEEELYANIVFKRFCNISFSSPIPDHSTICRWRERFSQCDLYEAIFNEALQQIIEHGIDVTTTVIVDSTSIESQARPKRRKEIVDVTTETASVSPVDNSSTPVTLTRIDSHDPDACWSKNGQGFWFGFKTTSSCSKQGIFTAMITSQANVYDGHQLKEILEKLSPFRGTEIMADKGFASKENSELLQSLGLIDRIMMKQTKNKILDTAIALYNKTIAATRFVIERSFGCLKKNIGIRRSPYLGLEKTHNFVLMGGMINNLVRCISLL